MGTDGNGNRSKVARVIDNHGLEGMGDQLVDSWQGEGEQQRSLRELADYFNRELLAAEMRGAGLRPLDGEVENMYRLLTDDEASGGQQVEAETKLEQAGLDPDEIRTDFVSHQAVHTYLTDYRDVEFPSREPADRTKSTLQAVQRTRGRLESVVEGSLSSLRSTEEFTIEEFDVVVTTQVYCEGCERRYEVAELLEQGGCDCK